MIGNLDDDALKGIMPKAFTHIFSAITVQKEEKGVQYLIRSSFIEIYNEEVRDLLSKYFVVIISFLDNDPNKPRKLEIKEDPNKGVYIKDCLIKIANTSQDLENNLKNGNKHKSVGETQMNRDSSRSHCIFTVYIETSETLKV